jgi:DNA-binding MarR family transcriptional regulator
MRLTAELTRQLAADSDLSYSDYLVLVALTGEGTGRLRSWELARDLGWEKSRLSHHLTRMVERGLVRKQACTTDRRGGYIAVTALGRRQIAAAAPAHVAAVRGLFLDHVTDQQLRALADVAEKVLAVLAAETPE